MPAAARVGRKPSWILWRLTVSLQKLENAALRSDLLYDQPRRADYRSSVFIAALQRELTTERPLEKPSIRPSSTSSFGDGLPKVLSLLPAPLIFVVPHEFHPNPHSSKGGVPVQLRYSTSSLGNCGESSLSSAIRVSTCTA